MKYNIIISHTMFSTKCLILAKGVGTNSGNFDGEIMSVRLATEGPANCAVLYSSSTPKLQEPPTAPRNLLTPILLPWSTL